MFNSKQDNAPMPVFVHMRPPHFLGLYLIRHDGRKWEIWGDSVTCMTKIFASAICSIARTHSEMHAHKGEIVKLMVDRCKSVEFVQVLHLMKFPSIHENCTINHLHLYRKWTACKSILVRPGKAVFILILVKIFNLIWCWNENACACVYMGTIIRGKKNAKTTMSSASSYA